LRDRKTVWGRATVVAHRGTATLEVDDATGIPVRFSDDAELSSPTDDSSLPEVTMEVARQAENAFLEDWRIRFGPAWRESAATHRDSGSGGGFWDFSFERRAGPVRLPARVWISVKASTGRLASFGLVDEPVTVPLEWRLSVDEAVARAAAAWSVPAFEVVSAELLVHWEPLIGADLRGGLQRVLWRVELRSDDLRYHSGLADVDAVTGEVFLRPWQGLAPPHTPSQRAAGKRALARAPRPNRGHPLKAPPTIFQRMKARPVDPSRPLGTPAPPK
jgi:hypothetical protein